MVIGASVVKCECDTNVQGLARSRQVASISRVPTPPGKSWIFFLKAPENRFGPGKSRETKA